ncbi:MAG: DUF748 domain-containing protein [Proteobacteria bacterium]|nr:DUF748 domain-containing protein [Pseudomonadota bacterium]
MTRRRKILVITGGLFAVYLMAVYFVLSAVLTRMVPDKLAEQLGRQVAIDHIRVNPLTLSVTVRGLDIKDKNTTDSFVRFETLYVNAEVFSLFKRGLVLKALHLEKPRITIVRQTDTAFNFSDLITAKKGDEQPKPEGQEPSRPFYFEAADISIIDGVLVYRDAPLNETHTMDPINWHVPFISNFTKFHDSFSEPTLACMVDGASVSVDVRVKPFKDTQETVVDLSVTGLSIPRYTAYIPSELVHFQVTRGSLDLGARISFRKEGQAPLVSAQGQLAVVDLGVVDKDGHDILTLPRLQMTLLPSVVTENSVHIGEVIVQAPSLSALRKADGTINLAGLVTGSDTGSPDGEPDAAGDAKEKDTDSGKTFRVDVDRFVLEKGTVRFTDSVPGGDSPVETTINDLNVTVAPFSNDPSKQSAFDVSTKINGRAPVGLKGLMTLSPFSLESDYSLSELALAWGQPYFPENVKLVITGGTAATSGHVALAMDNADQISATITCDANIREFASVDPEKAESFLKWSDFTVDGVTVSLWPLRVSVNKIAFTGLKNQLVVFEDGSTSVRTIFIEQEVPPETSEKTSEAETVTPMRIGKFQMSNTEFRFVDRSVTPHYSTRLSLKDLAVTGLTSEDFKAADVVAKGTIDGNAKVSITGTINPLSKDLFVDLDVGLANMEMVPFSTYTGKYVGRAIEKGKLNVDVKYHIKEKAIAADNHVLMDRFTLGKTVESKDALNLPVGLAVSLLTDRKGVIDINMPISGRTDDPDFAWGKVVLKALGNLIMKAATSPFALVGSLVGGGEELRFIEFENGISELDEIGRKKLDAVRTLLVERPALKLEIVGYVDKETDRKALAQQALDRMIKAPFLVDAAKNGKIPDANTLAAIVMTPEQREKSLRKLYKKEVEKKAPDGVIVKKTNDPTLTQADMEAALLERTLITDADLQSLAMVRAGQVKENLLEGDLISGDRIYLKEPDSPFKTATDEFKPSRVELGVK